MTTVQEAFEAIQQRMMRIWMETEWAICVLANSVTTYEEHSELRDWLAEHARGRWETQWAGTSPIVGLEDGDDAFAVHMRWA